MYAQLNLSEVISLRSIVINSKTIYEFFGINKDPILGLEIGSTAVKIMLLSKKADIIKVEKYAFEPLEPGVVVEKNIVNKEKVVAAIKAVMNKVNAPSNKVCVSIPNSASIIRTIKMSKELSDKEIGSEIELEAERYIPYPLDEINLDYTVVGPADEADLVNVVLAVSKTENIDKIVDILTDAGLEAVVVDVDSFAIQRAFEYVSKKLPSQARNKIIALFDIGATITTLNVFEKGRIIYTREQAFGGQHLIDEIQNIYGLNYQEAIKSYTQNTLPEDYYVEVLEPFKQTMAQQINRFCQYFFSSGDYNAVDYVFLTGGVSDIPGLDTIVQNKLQAKTLIANPFAEFEISSTINAELFKKDSSRFMICLGLALRNVL